MKLKLIICSLFMVLNLFSSEYIIQLNKKHYDNIIVNKNKKQESNIPSVDTIDKSGTLTLNQITNSEHVLGEGWFSFKESTVNEFSSFSSSIYTVINSNHSKFAIYHSEDLYLIFERPLSSNDGLNSHSRPYWNVNNSNVFVNNNNVNLSTYVHIITHSSISGLIFSDVSFNPWCSIVIGYYGGTCYNGKAGAGDWTIFVK